MQYFNNWVKFFKPEVSYETIIALSMGFFAFLTCFLIAVGKYHTLTSIPVPYFGNSDFQNANIYLSDIVFLLLILATLFNRKFHDFVWKSSLSLVFCFIILIIIPRETITMWYPYSIIRWIELFCALYLFSKNDLLVPSFLGFTVAGAIQGLVALGQYLLQRSIGLKLLGEQVLSPIIPGVAKIDYLNGKIMRAYGTFTHPNQLAAFLIVSCATSIYLLLIAKNEKLKYFLYTCLGLSIVGEILTFSRTGILGLIIFLGISFYLLRKNNPFNLKKVYLNFKIILISFVIVLIFILPKFIVRTEFKDNALSARVRYDQIGINIFQAHWFIGSGAGSLMTNVALRTPPVSYNWDVQPPHNYFLIVADETGLLGLILILLFFAKLLLDLFHQLKNSEIGEYQKKVILLSLLISFLFLMQFDHYFYTLQQTQLFLWILLGIIVGVLYRKEKIQS